MQTKGWAGITISALVMGLAAVAGSHAGTTMPVNTQIKASYDRTKTTVEFTHQKHITDHKVACGDCHHDAKGKPLVSLKEGDNVQTCFECHKKPGEVKGKEAKDLSDKDKLAYHANALHENCIGCHRQYNKEMKKKLAPQTCTDCHPKDK